MCRKSISQAGFTLVMFVMIIAVMSIMMGAAVQSISFQMQREREAELIFRGEQYVEAIRLYKVRYGRNPMRLKEIWEADPKVIRKKWKDPITDSENWGIIFVGQEGRGVGRNLGLNGTPGAETPLPTGTPAIGGGRGGRGRSGQGNNNGLPPGVSRNDEGELIGPIAGVHSNSCDESIRVYQGRNSYCEWEFVYKERRQPGRGGGGRGGGRGGGFGGGGGDRGGGQGDRDRSRTPLPYPTGTPHP